MFLETNCIFHIQKSKQHKTKKPSDYDANQLFFRVMMRLPLVSKGAEKSYISLANPNFNKASFKFIISYGEK
ncbi:hypothetical protein [Enterococcus sp. DIV1420a]|uniref:hypothetical protein n=1 Tax=Enterococcus sp. DIV1420a TaxID=2774672 RepID=UPI003F288593